MNAQIQLQNVSGTWFTVSTVLNKDQFVRKALDSAAQTYKKRVRAIDDQGRLIDMRG